MTPDTGKIKLIIALLLAGCIILPLAGSFETSPTVDEWRHFYTARWFLTQLPIPSYTYHSYSPPLEAFNYLPVFLSAPMTHVPDMRFFQTYLPLARPITLLYTLLLALLVYFWARERNGREAAAWALALYAFNPGMIAHACLLTTDLAMSWLSLLCAYTLWKALSSPLSFSRQLAVGVSFGLGLLAKFNFLMMVPALLLTGALFWLCAPRTQKRAVAGKLICAVITMAFCGLFLLYLGYYRFPPWPFHWPPIPAEYLFGFNKVIEESLQGRDHYLMGSYSMTGWPHYFLLSFLLKTPIPLLLLIIIACWITLRSKNRASWRDDLFLLVPPLVIFSVASLQHCQIGLRHILPVYPFLTVFCARILPWAQQKTRLTQALLAGLLLWLIVSTLASFPRYISYFNELIGGSRNGYRYFVDSNVDWGQDLIRLKKFMDAHKIKKIKLDYFGNAEPEFYGIRWEPIPKGPTTGFLAISVTHLKGLYIDSHDHYAWLDAYRPYGWAGESIVIYRIEQ